MYMSRQYKKKKKKKSNGEKKILLTVQLLYEQFGVK